MPDDSYAILSPNIRALLERGFIKNIATACRLQGAETVLSETFGDHAHPIAARDFERYIVDLNAYSYYEATKDDRPDWLGGIKVTGQNGWAAFINERHSRILVIKEDGQGRYDELKIIYSEGKDKDPVFSPFDERVMLSTRISRNMQVGSSGDFGMTVAGAETRKNRDGTETVEAASYQGWLTQPTPQSKRDVAEIRRNHQIIHNCTVPTS